MSTLPSYKDRGGRDCLLLGTPDQPCWGQVMGSPRGLLCEGHIQPQYQSPEQTKAEKIARALRQAEQADVAEKERLRKKRADYRAWNKGRWFRPHIEAALAYEGPQPWSTLSTPLLRCLFSMLGEGFAAWDGPKDPRWREWFIKTTLPIIAEVHRRGMRWPVGIYDLKLISGQRGADAWDRQRDPFSPTELRIDVSGLRPEELHLWYGSAALTLDYSCLALGVRQTLGHLYNVVCTEMKARGLEFRFMGDLDEAECDLNFSR